MASSLQPHRPQALFCFTVLQHRVTQCATPQSLLLLLLLPLIVRSCVCACVRACVCLCVCSPRCCSFAFAVAPCTFLPPSLPPSLARSLCVHAGSFPGYPRGTAQVQTGKAIKESGLSRSDIFVTSKIPQTDLGYNSTIASVWPLAVCASPLGSPLPPPRPPPPPLVSRTCLRALSFSRLHHHAPADHRARHMCDLSCARLRSGALLSLKQLQLDYIDLMLIHWPGVGGKPTANPTKSRQDTWRVRVPRCGGGHLARPAAGDGSALAGARTPAS